MICTLDQDQLADSRRIFLRPSSSFLIDASIDCQDTLGHCGSGVGAFAPAVDSDDLAEETKMSNQLEQQPSLECQRTESLSPLVSEKGYIKKLWPAVLERPALTKLDQLVQLVAGLDVQHSNEASPALASATIALSPGDALLPTCAEPSCVYVVNSGLLLRGYGQNDGSHSSPVNFLGVGDWIDLLQTVPGRSNGERILAVAPTELFAIGLEAISSIQDASRLGAQIIARLRSRSLMREWRLIYQLHDLGCAEVRLITGLIHLLNRLDGSIHATADDGFMPLNLSLHTLAQWLDLTQASISDCLRHLRLDDSLKVQGEQIKGWRPQQLMSQLHIASSAVLDSDGTVIS